LMAIEGRQKVARKMGRGQPTNPSSGEKVRKGKAKRGVRDLISSKEFKSHEIKRQTSKRFTRKRKKNRLRLAEVKKKTNSLGKKESQERGVKNGTLMGGNTKSRTNRRKESRARKRAEKKGTVVICQTL